MYTTIYTLYPTSSFPHLSPNSTKYDEQHWSVLLSGLKNRHMTTTKCILCASDFVLPFCIDSLLRRTKSGR
jgi:hypothetical protein